MQVVQDKRPQGGGYDRSIKDQDYRPENSEHVSLAIITLNLQIPIVNVFRTAGLNRVLKKFVLGAFIACFLQTCPSE